MVCGAAKAGKTNFTYLLRNKKLKEKYESTGVSDTKQVVVKQKSNINSDTKEAVTKLKFNICGTDWTDLTDKLEYEELIQTLLSELNKQHIEEDKLDEEVSEGSNTEIDDQPTNQLVQNLPSQTKSEDNINHFDEHQGEKNDKIIQDEKVDSERNMTNTDYVTIPPELYEGKYIERRKMWDMLTILDTGGQPELINLLPAINTSAAVSFIALDLSDGVDCLKQLVLAQSSNKNYEEYKTSYTNFHLLKCLLSFIKLSARRRIQYPKFVEKVCCNESGVCFLGTHADILLRKLLDIEVKSNKNAKTRESSEGHREHRKNKSCFTNNLNELNVLVNDLVESLKEKESLRDEEVESIKYTVKKSFNNDLNAINEQIEILVSEIDKDDKLDVWNINDMMLTPVDNTTAGKPQDENHTAEVIRAKIAKVVENRQFEIPVVWFILELQLRCEEKIFISLDYVKVLSDRIMPNNQKIDKPYIKEILKFFHALGTLMYFDGVDIAQDYVITDPQWLFDTLTDLVNCTLAYKVLKTSVINAFKYRGILSDELLNTIELRVDKIHLDDHINSDDENIAKKKKRKLFLKLLEHLKVIAPTDQLYVGDKKNQCYFMPSVLPPCKWSEIKDSIFTESEFGKQIFYKDKEEYLVEPLLIEFTYGTIPRGFLCFLAVQLLQKNTKWKVCCPNEKQNWCQFDNLIIFRTDINQFLAIIDRTFYLELQVRIKNIKDKNPHYEIKSAVTDALKVICKDFDSQFTDLRYGFLCKECKGSSDDGHLTIPECSCDNLFAECRNYRGTKLEDKHKIWLKVCNNNKYKLYVTGNLPDTCTQA